MPRLIYRMISNSAVVLEDGARTLSAAMGKEIGLLERGLEENPMEQWA